MALRICGFLFLLFLAAADYGVAMAQTAKPMPPFGRVAKDWSRTFEQAAEFAQQPDLNPILEDSHLQSLAKVRDLAKKFLADGNSRIMALERLAEAMGAAPTEGAKPEPDDLAAKRNKNAEDIAFYRARITAAAFAIAQAEELESAILSPRRQAQISNIFQLYPLPFHPSTVRIAIPELGAKLRSIGYSPFDWWGGLSATQRSELIPLQYFMMVIIVAGFVGWFVRNYLLRNFGRDPNLADPSYGKRLAAGVAEGIARGIIPALMLAGILWRVSSPGAKISGEFADVVIALCIGLIIVVLAVALPRSVLAPDSPDWRLAPVGSAQGRAVCHWIVLLAGLFAFDLFMRITADVGANSPELISFYNMVSNSLEGVVLLFLMRGVLWRQPAQAEVDGTEQAPLAPAIKIPGFRSGRCSVPLLRFAV